MIINKFSVIKITLQPFITQMSENSIIASSTTGDSLNSYFGWIRIKHFSGNMGTKQKARQWHHVWLSTVHNANVVLNSANIVLPCKLITIRNLFRNRAKSILQWRIQGGCPRRAPLTVQFFLNCMQFVGKCVCWRLPLEGWPPSDGESWIRPCT